MMGKEDVSSVLSCFSCRVCQNLDPDVCDANLRGCEMWCALSPAVWAPVLNDLANTVGRQAHFSFVPQGLVAPVAYILRHIFLPSNCAPLQPLFCSTRNFLGFVARWHPQSIKIKRLCVQVTRFGGGSAREILIWTRIYGNFRDCFLINAKWQAIKFLFNNKEAVTPVDWDCCHE